MELRQTFADADDLIILWVMASNQINDRTRAFIDEFGLRDRVRFLSDPDSTLITQFGLLKANPEEVEAGVPVPTTYLIDRKGVVRFADAREDFHIWLDANTIADQLAHID